MLISLSKKFIFIHIYKVAGTSIHKSLVRYDCRQNIVNRTLNKAINKSIIITPREVNVLENKNNVHIKACELEEKIPKLFGDLYKFAFVRNPWDWQVSLYHYMLKNTNHRFHKKVKELGSFREYLKWLIHENGFSLQSEFLLDQNHNELLVDYIGRLETIEEDFKFLCKKLSLDATLPTCNTSNHKKYTDYYDQETFQWIVDNFKKDIDLLGYEFDSYKEISVHKLINRKLKKQY